MDRRDLLKLGLTGLSLPIAGCSLASPNRNKVSLPLVISTWDFGREANKEAWTVLASGGKALDAVEKGVRVTEADPNNLSVGYGALPDREGNITLDACIMDELGRCGSVAYLQNIMHPISVARMIMEKTPHVMLVGNGALKFAIENGFTKEDLHTERSRAAYEKWLQTSEYKTEVNRERHDTIGMLAIDQAGNISGACTTSGMSYKLAGRVGDSPIIGAGLYVDNEVGGAVATGLGEEIIRVSGSAIIVELMRQGASPKEACKEMVRRVQQRNASVEDIQVCFIALDKTGRHAGYAMHSGFEYAIHSTDGVSVVPSLSLLPEK